MKASLLLLALTLGFSSVAFSSDVATEQPATQEQNLEQTDSVIKHKKALEEQEVEIKDEASTEENN